MGVFLSETFYLVNFMLVMFDSEQFLTLPIVKIVKQIVLFFNKISCWLLFTSVLLTTKYSKPFSKQAKMEGFISMEMELRNRYKALEKGTS